MYNFSFRTTSGRENYYQLRDKKIAVMITISVTMNAERIRIFVITNSKSVSIESVKRLKLH